MEILIKAKHPDLDLRLALENTLSKLSDKDKKKPIYVYYDRIWSDKPLYYYQLGNFYEAKVKIIREFIQSRGNGKPNKESIDIAIDKIDLNNKGIKFNYRCTTNYGDWVVEAVIVKNKKIIDLNILQNIINIEYNPIKKEE